MAARPPRAPRHPSKSAFHDARQGSLHPADRREQRLDPRHERIDQPVRRIAADHDRLRIEQVLDGVEAVAQRLDALLRSRPRYADRRVRSARRTRRVVATSMPFGRTDAAWRSRPRHRFRGSRACRRCIACPPGTTVIWPISPALPLRAAEGGAVDHDAAAERRCRNRHRRNS